MRTFKTLALAGALIASISGIESANARSSCALSPRVIGACFTVHARLRVGNGTPSVRIWPIGSHRILGVLGGNYDAEAGDLFPPPFPALLDFDASYYGDYVVCPLTSDLTGTMRMVCVDSVKGFTSANVRDGI